MSDDYARERLDLLYKIKDSYECAKKRLAMANIDIPLVRAGLSFGLLDLTSNIIYNTLTANNLCRPGAAAADNLSDMKAMDMAHRSLDGLVAFLTCFFRYLVDWEAVRYLIVAGGDLVLAVHDRCLYMFDLNSDTSKAMIRTALMCAALASKDMDPHHLIQTWLSPSCSLEDASAAIQNDDALRNFTCLFSTARRPAPGMQMQPLVFAWKRALAAPTPTAARRFGRYSLPVKLTVLEQIHSFYLRALARLPASGLRSRYHHSARMLKAGHCYGPFDPVTNIIINTIWYGTVSPPTKDLELDMLSTKSLLRIEARAFYGLVSLLGARGKKKLHEAMRILLYSNCTLAPTFWDHNYDTCKHALRAAGEAAWHPNPAAQAEFLSSCSRVSPLPPGDAPLNSYDVGRLARMLCPTPVILESVHRPQINSRIARYRMANWMDDYTTISRKVRAALASFALRKREPVYDLHVICGVNHSVSGPDPESCDTYHHTHVNFLASRRGEKTKLFVAELSNDNVTENEDGKELLCCPVDFPRPCQEQIRCLYCDYQGTKIVHPYMEEFQFKGREFQFKGRDVEFQDMVCGKDPYDEEIDPDFTQLYTNYTIVSVSRHSLDHVGALIDDYIYTDYDDDPDKENMHQR